jgi:hypothetical protein
MHSIGANAADATSRRALNWSPKVCRQLQAVLGHRVSQNWYSIIRRAMHPPNFILLIADGRTRCGGFELSYATDAAYPRELIAHMWPGASAKPQTGRSSYGVGEPRFKAFGERASPVPHRWMVNFIQTPVGQWAHTCFDRAVVASRPGLQSNLSAETHLGVRNLAPKHVGRKETTWNYLQC